SVVSDRLVVCVQITEISPAVLVDLLTLCLKRVVSLNCSIRERAVGVLVNRRRRQVRHRFGRAVPLRIGFGARGFSYPIERRLADSVVAEGNDELLGNLLTSLKFVGVREFQWKETEAYPVLGHLDRFRKPLPKVPLRKRRRCRAPLKPNDWSSA